MSSGGGTGNAQQTLGTWSPFMENMWAGGQNGNTGLLNRAVSTLNTPYQPYSGQRNAGFTWDQNQAMDLTRQTALGNGGYGDPATAAGRDTAMRAAQGGLTNKYEGDSPYFRLNVAQQLDDITNAYKNGTSADTTRAFNMSGAFGGSAHQKAVANNEAALAKQLGNTTNQAYQQQYDRSAGLAESGLNRQMSAIPLAYQSQGLGFDAANQLMGMGTQQQNLAQRNLDTGYNDWTTGMNWERGNVDWLANLLGRAQGSTGASTTTSTYGSNPASALLGGGLLASSLFGGK